ncbi:hypothetical protein CspHIS471_0404310 [Cutaneotrichosporon sp. HIS471]|nr:hypothetical protein CspHIS471_0404310 [Cutaneotrichosporon sp. HIS471]
MSDLTSWEKRYDPDTQHARLATAADLADPTANIACAYNNTGEMHMLVKDMPIPQTGEVLLRVRATGICESDVHLWEKGGPGSTHLTTQVGAGRESGGEVIALGKGVSWQIGDRVAIEEGIPCGRFDCDSCLRAIYDQCPNIGFHLSPPYNGTMTRYKIYPGYWLHRLPDSVGWDEGALCEPLAVALAALESADVRLGNEVLICGAGPIGLLVLLCARACGAHPIIMTDLQPSRLEFARTLVPSVLTVLSTGDDSTGKETASRVREHAQVVAAIECTGAESSIATAVYSCQPRGCVVVVGSGLPRPSYPFKFAVLMEIKMEFLLGYAHQFPRALRVLEGGVIDVKPLVTHRFPLARAVEGFKTAKDLKEGAIKVQIVDE